MIKALKAYAIGASHLRKGIVYQDFADKFESEEHCIVAISDGHGDEQCVRSDRGSRFAVEIAIECIKTCMAETSFVEIMKDNKAFQAKKREEAMETLKESIVNSWNDRVKNDLNDNSFSVEELENFSEKQRDRLSDFNYSVKAYGATIVAAVMHNDFWFAIQVGDGAFLALNKGVVLPWQLFLGKRGYVGTGDKIITYWWKEKKHVENKLKIKPTPRVLFKADYWFTLAETCRGAQIRSSL